jgi:hypothetical protein
MSINLKYFAAVLGRHLAEVSALSAISSPGLYYLCSRRYVNNYVTSEAPPIAR